MPVEVGSSSDSPETRDFVGNMMNIYYSASSDPTKDELAFCKVCPSNSLFISSIINHIFSHLPIPFRHLVHR